MKEKPTVSDRLRDLRFFSGEPTLEEVSKETGISTTALSTLLEALSQGIHYPLSKFTEEEKDMLMGLFERSGAVKEGTRMISRGKRRRGK